MFGTSHSLNFWAQNVLIPRSRKCANNPGAKCANTPGVKCTNIPILYATSSCSRIAIHSCGLRTYETKKFG